MSDFLEKLYSYEHFSTILIIAIIVLVILFIIVLFMGKKDQKKREIEETKKLEQLNISNTFKDEETSVPLEVKDEKEKLENDTIVVPKIEDISVVPGIQKPDINEIPVMNNNIEEPVKGDDNFIVDLPIVNPIEDKMSINDTQDTVPEVVPKTEVVESPKVDIEPVMSFDKPILERDEEKPIIISDDVFTQPEKEESLINEQNASVPDFDLDEILRSAEDVKEATPEEMVNTNKPLDQEEVFSSVFTEPINEKDIQKEETNEEDDFELPVLKKEAVEESPKNNGIDVPVLNDYNLDSLAGETYTINK